MDPSDPSANLKQLGGALEAITKKKYVYLDGISNATQLNQILPWNSLGTTGVRFLVTSRDGASTSGLLSSKITVIKHKTMLEASLRISSVKQRCRSSQAILTC